MKNTNGQHIAFPIFDDKGRGYTNEKGLTKREYFAAMAIQGLQSNQLALQQYSIKKLAEFATRTADYLIQALNEDIAD